MSTDSIKKNVFLAYLLAIYLSIEIDCIQEETSLTQSSYPRLVNNCMRYCNQPPKKQDFICTYYKWTIPSKDMSFFLRSFKETSVISGKIFNAFSFRQTDTQRAGVENLLKAPEQSPYEIFNRLTELFNVPLP